MPLNVADQDPSVKIPAIKKAVREKDLKAAGQMIDDLESDDAAVRLYAINGLQALTGERFGYEYYADDSQRQQAVGRWRQWLANQKPTTNRSR